jgi:hypothetical protein
MIKLIKPTPPRYDKVFYDGVRWLDWIALHEDMGICVHFQNIDRGIWCTGKNCPCDLYQPEEI